MKQLIAAIFVCIIALVALPYKTKTTYAEQALPPAHDLMLVLANLLPQNRTAFSAGEAQAASALSLKLSEFGATNVSVQNFSVNLQHSQNVIGFLPSVAPSTNLVIFGAHYDNIYSPSTNGYGDNLSGVAALLQTLQKTKLTNYNYNAWFVLFGAEEVGAKGSEHFVKTLTAQERANIFMFINLDSVGLGDELFYSNGGSKTEYLRFAQKVNYDLGNRFSAYTPNLVYPSVGSQSVSSLLMQSDMRPFLQNGINAITLFAGSKTPLLGRWKESTNHANISHKTDTKATAEQVFGASFYFNIEFASDFAAAIPKANGFLNECLPMQLQPYYLSLNLVKLVSVLVMVAFFVFGWFSLHKRLTF